MSPKKAPPSDDPKPLDDSDDEESADEDLDIVEVDVDPDLDIAEVLEPDDEEEVLEVEADDEEEDVDEVVAVAEVEPRKKPAPSQRSPMGKDEPPPPFAIGERVILVQNTRPRTGTPIGEYAVGSQGVVEAVLSLTAVVRFDDPPQTKEVVAFDCLKSASKPKG